MKRTNRNHTHRSVIRVAVGVLASALLLCAMPAAYADGTAISLSETFITADKRDYSWLTSETETYTYDFTATDIQFYSKDEKLANVSLRTNMVFDGQTLSCKPDKTFSFGSAVFLGDDYGIRGGELSFDLKQTGGRLSVGLRLSKQAADPSKRGIWFSLDGTGSLTVTVPDTSLSATLTGIPADTRLTFHDTVSTIEVLSDDTVVATVLYNDYNGAVTVCRPNGTAIGSADTSAVNAAGYFTLYADGLSGTIDNLTFTHSVLTRSDRVTAAPTVDYSSWVATDDRDRETPTNETVGDVKTDKQVGVFYFVNHTGSASETLRDNTYLYNTLGLDGMKSYLTNPANADAYYWAEPYFGYYLNTDSWVQRKHAYMLEAAGVDFIFVDVSNGATYDRALISLFDTWKAIRDEGGSTPDICFLAAGSIGAVWNNIKGYIYDESGTEKYGDLFYQYDGKPLLMCDLSVLDTATQSELRERFTIRHCWAWSLTAGQWNWLQEYKIDANGNAVLSNGSWGLDENGNPEELALCMGHHPTTSKGRSYLNGTILYRDDYGFGLDSGAGTGFANSFKAVKQLDPSMLLITGWNEWISGLNQDEVKNFAGTATNAFSFVDQFNTEYSRDGEPMKLRDGEGVGFGDNYYYQMASYIREFKGWSAAPDATGQTTILLDDLFAWETVGPTFTDTANDTEWRSEVGYFGGYTYVNNTGRNDLLTAKVSQDATYLYFTVTTAENVVIADDSDWMNLYLNIDGDSTNGWEGFDFVLNRARDGHYVAVESLSDGWEGRHVGQALYTVSGHSLTIRLAKSVIGLSGTATALLFKWADNATVGGHVMEFMDRGDTAPNDRYAYRYTCAEGTASDVPTLTYSLTATDGTTVDTRDEATPLPGVTAPTEDDTTPWDSTDTRDNPDSTDEPGTGHDDNGGRTVYRYSDALKLTIVLTGAVLGGCLYAAIVIPHNAKRRKPQQK